MGENGSFRSAFAVGEFRAMWAAGLLSIIGDQLARVALVSLVYLRTGSAALTGLTFALTLVPSFFSGILLSGLADRFPRRRVMVVADLLRAGLIALVAVPGTPFALLCGLVGAVSFLNAPFRAGEQALLADVLPKSDFLTGMAIRNITNQSGQVLGFAAGGVLVSAINPYTALVLDAVTFLASAALLRFGVKSRPAAANTDTKRGIRAFIESTSGGISLAFKEPGLRALIVINWLTGIFIVYEGLAAPYAALLGGGTITVGLVLAADPLGSAIGAFLFGRFVPARLRPKVLGLICLASGVPLLICFAHPGLVVSIALFVVAGAFGTATYMQSTASVVQGTPDDRRAQTLGLCYAGMTATQGLSPLVGGIVADHIGAASTVGWFGVAGLLVAVPVAVAWKRATARRPDIWLHTSESGVNSS